MPLPTVLDHSIQVSTIDSVFSEHIDAIDPQLVARSLRNILENRGHPARSAVVEHVYIDRDFTASYYMQASRSFIPTHRLAKRIHFFSARITKREIQYATRRTVARMQDAYLGYTVVRPGSPSTLGRTFIRQPESVDGEPCFCPAQMVTPVNLLGIDLEIWAAPYIEQDKRVLACATAALWMSTTPLYDKDQGGSSPTTSDITQLGVGLQRTFGPSVGGAGLTIDEMKRAILQLGYDPLTFQKPAAEPLARACYEHLESGLAPILVVGIAGAGRHAVTVVGHTTRKRNNEFVPFARSYQGLYSSNVFVGSFVVHDDRQGMYLPAAISKCEPDDNEFGAKAVVEFSGDGGRRPGYVLAMLIPYPARVMTPVHSALANAAEVIADLRSNGWIESRDLILRAVLARSNTFKSHLSRRSGMPDGLQRFYRWLPMPRYIWVVEFGYRDSWVQGNAREFPVCGEIILDSTNPPADNIPRLAIHSPGLVTGVVTGDPEPTLVWSRASATSVYEAYSPRGRP